jgi:protein-S-isoprenylcysteine O-methyltransferase Ste14
MMRAYATLGTVCFLFVAPGTVAGLIPWWISRWQMQAPLFGFSAIRVVGVLLIVLGIPLVLESFARFALKGLGTPAPVLPTRHLVTSGFYRYVRNPMYIGVFAVIVGQGLLLGNVTLLWYGVAVGMGFHVFVLAYEEPTLRRTFGEEYETFCANVPRWIPRLSLWKGTGP